MTKLNLRSITNRFLDARLVSLASWHQAKEVLPRDHIISRDFEAISATEPN